jgi:hypothetical protein
MLLRVRDATAPLPPIRSALPPPESSVDTVSILDGNDFET